LFCEFLDIPLEEKFFLLEEEIVCSRLEAHKSCLLLSCLLFCEILPVPKGIVRGQKVRRDAQSSGVVREILAIPFEQMMLLASATIS
jgi:hypothetical protein